MAIFGPLSQSASEHVRSITDSMEIPFIETRWNYRSQKVIGEAILMFYSQRVSQKTKGGFVFSDCLGG